MFLGIEIPKILQISQYNEYGVIAAHLVLEEYRRYDVGGHPPTSGPHLACPSFIGLPPFRVRPLPGQENLRWGPPALPSMHGWCDCVPTMFILLKKENNVNVEIF